jgi:hypothetical protein
MSAATNPAGRSPADLLRLAHAAFCACTTPFLYTVHLNHPAPGASWAAGLVQRYTAVLTYPGTVLVRHTPYGIRPGLVTASRPGDPETPDDAAHDPADIYTDAERRALLRKASAALRKVAHLSGWALPIEPDPSASGGRVLHAFFAFPGILTVSDRAAGQVFAVSQPGRPTVLDVEATQAAARTSLIEKGPA